MKKSCLILKPQNVCFSDELYLITKKYIKQLLDLGYKQFIVQSNDNIITSIINFFKAEVVKFNSNNENFYLNLFGDELFLFNGNQFSVIEFMKKFDYTLVFGLDWDMKEYFKTMLSDLKLNYTVIYQNKQYNVGQIM